MPDLDQLWVAGACDPASPQASEWPRYRLGDLTIAVPRQYRVSEAIPYTLRFRDSYGGLTLTLHRNAGYSFDDINQARRGQIWCNGSLGGHQAEIIAWSERFRGSTYNFAARLRADWGGQDEGKWLYVSIAASRRQEAYVLRDALHTIRAVRDSIP